MTLNPEVFREAAELMFEGHDFACQAIRAVTENNLTEECYINFFESILKPDSSRPGSAWMTEACDRETHEDTRTGRTRRVIALLLAAEVLESGGYE